MQGKAGDGVDHRLGRGIDRDPRVQGGEPVRERRHPLVRQEYGHGLHPRRPRQQPQHDLALGDEQALASHQIPFPHVAIGGDAGILRVIDGDGGGTGLHRTGLGEAHAICHLPPPRRSTLYARL